MKKKIQIKPQLCLARIDGNAFGLIGKCIITLKRAGVSQDSITQFETEATSGNYDHLIRTLQTWFDVQLTEEGE